MNPGSLIRLILANVSRAKKNFLMSGFGIIVGISTFVFFIGLGDGIKDVVLGKIFLVDQVEIVPRSFDTGFGQINSGTVLDDSVAENPDHSRSQRSLPKMKFTFPTRGYGAATFWPKLMGRDHR